MQREIPKGGIKDNGDYLQHKKDFKEVASITMYTEGYKAAMAKTTNSIGTCFFSVVPKNEEGEEFILITAGIQKMELRIYAPFMIGGARPRSMIRDNYGKEMDLGGSGRKRWVLTVKKVNGDIAKLATDSIPKLEDNHSETLVLPKENKEKQKKKCKGK